MIRSLPYNLKLKQRMPLHWQSLTALNPSPPRDLLPWLVDPSSFMQRLRNHGVEDAQVKLLRQHWQYPSHSEQKLLGIAPRQYGLMREVVISRPQQGLMFARTVFPRATLSGREQWLARLKNRALGTMLFNNPHASRGPFEYAVISQHDLWQQKMNKVANLSEAYFWARRCVFVLNHKLLLLCEVFLPDLMEL
jgi:chorismate--pyruvate lyase